jgi:hypothetical protein
VLLLVVVLKQALPKAVDTQKDILTAEKGARYRRIGAGMKASATSKPEFYPS